MRKILLITLLFLLQVAYAQKPVILTDFISQESLTDYQVHFYYDPNCTFDISTVFSPYYADKFQGLDFSNEKLKLDEIKSGDCLWFRFVVENRGLKEICYHLQPGMFSTFGEFKLYQRYKNGVIIKRQSGYKINPKKKDANISGSDDLRFYITPGNSDTLYLYASVIDESVIPELTFTVSTHDVVINKDKARRVTFGIFLGIMVIMIFYHLTIYIQVREVSYLYYILYIVAFLAFFINKEGYVYELIFQFTSEPINTFLLEIFLLCFLLLGRAYLDTNKYLRAWDRVLLLAIGFIASGLILHFIMIVLSNNGKQIPYLLTVILLLNLFLLCSYFLGSLFYFVFQFPVDFVFQRSILPELSNNPSLC